MPWVPLRWTSRGEYPGAGRAGAGIGPAVGTGTREAAGTGTEA